MAKVGTIRALSGIYLLISAVFLIRLKSTLKGES
jgi:hypothetical protein